MKEAFSMLADVLWCGVFVYAIVETWERAAK